MDGLETLTTRRSVRKFKPDAVPKELLEKIIDAGRLAPTARNLQPWEFIVITDADKRAEIARTTDHGPFIADAPVCIAVLSHPTKYFLEDGCAATTNILNAAAAVGLGACWVAGDKKPYTGRIVELCAAPTEMKLIALIAVGYPASIAPPKKRSLDDVLHWEAYHGS